MDRPISRSRQRREDSVRALMTRLQLICARDIGWVPPDDFREAMRSQGALARYENHGLGLIGMSLNTQKTIADQCCDGYETLDALRVAGLAAIEARDAKQQEPGRGTKDVLRKENEELSRRIERLEHDLGQLTWAFGRVVGYARSQAQEIDDPHAIARFVKELRSIESGLSLLKRPLGTNVVSGAFGA